MSAKTPITVARVAEALDAIAPNRYAEAWDNTGLLLGDPAAEAARVLLTIDLTEAVLDEALAGGCGLVMAYHPPLFKPVASLRADRQGLLYRAIRGGVAAYSVHTAWDVVPGGANDLLADALGMAADARRPIQPTHDQDARKVTVFLPAADLEAVRSAAFAAGAGAYGHDGNYSECGFCAAGHGSFRASERAHPTAGTTGSRQSVPELRWETICPAPRLAEVLRAIRAAHSYECPAIDVTSLGDLPPGHGVGRVGELKRSVTLKGLLARAKRACGVPRALLATVGGLDAPVRRIAVGCGAGGSIFRDAIAAGAEVFVTGELRHHDALAARAAGMSVICVNHSNSERLTLEPLARRLAQRVEGIETVVSRADADPFAFA